MNFTVNRGNRVAINLQFTKDIDFFIVRLDTTHIFVVTALCHLQYSSGISSFINGARPTEENKI